MKNDVIQGSNQANKIKCLITCLSLLIWENQLETTTGADRELTMYVLYVTALSPPLPSGTLSFFFNYLCLAIRLLNFIESQIL